MHIVPIEGIGVLFFMAFSIETGTKLIIEGARVDIQRGIVSPYLRAVDWSGLSVRGNRVIISGQKVYTDPLPREAIFGIHIPDLHKHGFGEDPMANQPDTEGGFTEHVLSRQVRKSITGGEIHRIRPKGI